MTYLLLQFMYEIVFGLDEIVPTDFYQWKFQIIPKIILYPMPNCADYYLNMFNENFYQRISNEDIIQSTILQLSEFMKLVNLRDKSKSDFSNYYRKYLKRDELTSNYFNEPFNLISEIKLAVLSIVHEEYAPTKLTMLSSEEKAEKDKINKNNLLIQINYKFI